MDAVSDVSVQLSGFTSPYVQVSRMHFKQNGQDRKWDLVVSHAAVIVVLFNTDRNKLVLVKQLRPAVYFAHIRRMHGICPERPAKDGQCFDSIPTVTDENAITTELCAGIVDKLDKSVAEIAHEEILEECGYRVPLENITFIQKFRMSVGIAGEDMSLFFATCTDAMKLENGGGGSREEHEWIDVVEMSIEEAKNFVQQTNVNTTPATLYGISWFLINKADKFTKGGGPSS